MPPPNVRRLVQEALREGDLTAESPLGATRGIGAYLQGRLARALGVAPPTVPTVGDFWRGTRRKTTEQLTRWLHRALQNARCNQCVSPRGDRAARDEQAAPADAARRYHAGDVNQLGYEACVALLDHARAHPPPGIGGAAVRYGALPIRLPSRPRSSKRCGCDADCSDPACVRSAATGLCVPRAVNARGFVGAPPRPGQRAAATSPRERERVRRAGYTRITPALRADSDAAADLAAGHARSMRFSPLGQNALWRAPGPLVRLPPVR